MRTHEGVAQTKIGLEIEGGGRGPRGHDQSVTDCMDSVGEIDVDYVD